MRKTAKLVGFIVFLAIIGLFMTTCDDTNGENGNTNDETNQSPTAGLLFTLVDGPAYEVSIGEADAVHIVIPATYNDLPVTTIKAMGFLDSSILSVIIPNSITTIGYFAFARCIGLTSITIPNSVITIDGSVFSGCIGLTSITVQENNLNYSSQGGILYNKEKTFLVLVPQGLSGSVIIPNSVTTIGDSAFYDCTGLTSITIPNSVTTIGSSTFIFWTSSQTIYIPFSTLAEADSAWLSSWRRNCNAIIRNNVGEQVYP